MTDDVRADTEVLVDNSLRVLYLSKLAPTLMPSSPYPPQLQTTGDGKDSRIVLEGSAGGGRFPPSQISAEDLTGAYAFLANIRSPSLTVSRLLLRICHGT